MSETKKMIANKYELVAPLGEGGMASVYRGADARRRRVHLSRGHQARAPQPRRGRRLRRHVRRGGARRLRAAASEHRAGARLRSRRRGALLHRHGVDRRHRSRRLDRVVRGTPTPWHVVAAIGVEILRGLGAAHDRVDGAGQPAPVIHRDVSPANVLLSVQGIVKLADFGLARAADRATMTAPGTVKGKLSYLAPELIKRAPASPRSDLFSRRHRPVGGAHRPAPLRRRRRLDIIKRIMANAGAAAARACAPTCRRRSDEIVHTALSFDPGRSLRDAPRRCSARWPRSPRTTPSPPTTRRSARSIRDAMRAHDLDSRM